VPVEVGDDRRVLGKVLLGRGTAYYVAAVEARDRTGRPRSEDTNLTVHWLERFAPAIIEALLPKPTKLGIVLIDALPFNVAAPDDRGFPIPGGRMIFNVMAAARQRRKGEPIEMLRLEGSWSKDLRVWRAFMNRLPGDAERIVSDAEQAILKTSQLRWPNAKRAVSEWHVIRRAETILVTAQRHSRRDPLYVGLRQSLKSAAAWRRFVRLARASGIAELEAWIIDLETVVEPQLARRDHPRTTGALESALARVKKDLALQRASYKDLPRLNLILGLMTLHANRTDRERDYTEIIRRNV
jgi:hypothetical protein